MTEENGVNEKETEQKVDQDIQDNKVMAALAYILFFLPLLVCKDSAFGKFHANQGLVLFIFGVIISIAGSVIPLIGWFIILPIGGIIALVFGIMGIINAFNGKMKRLPLIGSIDIIK
ncbi:MAG: DUF4870 domain-containing protein [Eubacteriales bacterium]